MLLATEKAAEEVARKPRGAECPGCQYVIICEREEREETVGLTQVPVQHLQVKDLLSLNQG